MNHRVHYNACPVCRSTAIDPILTAKDFTVSGETFSIWQCRDCLLRFTQDVPDAAHIAPYYKSDTYISHTNTAKGLVNQLYLRVRRHTLRIKSRLVQQATGLTNGRLLDVGAGTGAFVQVMQEGGWRVSGLEPDAATRELAARIHNVSLLAAEELFQLPTASFDAITLWHVLEHVHDLHSYIAQLKKLLATSGKLLIAVPNYAAVDASTYGSFWAAYDVPRHLYHFTPKAMKTLLKEHGLVLEAEKPMWFDSFYISLLSSAYHSGKTQYLGALWTGLRSNLATLGNTEKSSSLIYVIRKA